LILLIVTIGLLNICLGFGLAMYFGYGPPGLDGIFEAFGPMPPVAAKSNPGPGTEPQAISSHAYPLGRESMPPVGESTSPTSGGMPPSDDGMPPAELLAEEKVLGEVCEMAATAQTAVVSGQVESHE
jgi:hypothetical protein